MILPRWIRRNQRSLLYSTPIVLTTIAWILIGHARAKDHYLSTEVSYWTSWLPSVEQVSLSPAEARSICRASSFSPYQKTRKVYDLVLLNTELDWLEIRLHTISQYVDYIVVVEATTTFTGLPKPLFLKDNWARFKKFHHQIIHRVVEDPINSTRIWDHEDWLRNSLLYEVFPSLIGTAQAAQYGDVLIVSDMDEILRPETLLLVRYCDIPRRLIFMTDFYYYSFQWRHHGSQFSHPDATVFTGMSSTLSPTDLRQGLFGQGWFVYASFKRWWDRATIWDAGWHCSSSFASIDELRKKLDSFSHQPWNTPENRELSVLLHRIRHGLDLFGRAEETYDRVENNTDVPAYILEQYEQHGRFKYMIDRDGEDAGFEDWATAGLI